MIYLAQYLGMNLTCLGIKKNPFGWYNASNIGTFGYKNVTTPLSKSFYIPMVIGLSMKQKQWYVRNNMP